MIHVYRYTAPGGYSPPIVGYLSRIEADVLMLQPLDQSHINIVMIYSDTGVSADAQKCLWERNYQRLTSDAGIRLTAMLYTILKFVCERDRWIISGTGIFKPLASMNLTRFEARTFVEGIDRSIQRASHAGVTVETRYMDLLNSTHLSEKTGQMELPPAEDAERRRPLLSRENVILCTHLLNAVAHELKSANVYTLINCPSTASNLRMLVTRITELVSGSPLWYLEPELSSGADMGKYKWFVFCCNKEPSDREIIKRINTLARDQGATTNSGRFNADRSSRFYTNGLGAPASANLSII